MQRVWSRNYSCGYAKKNMNGTIGPSGEMVKNLCEQIEKSFDGKIEFWDERLTTVLCS